MKIKNIFTHLRHYATQYVEVDFNSLKRFNGVVYCKGEIFFSFPPHDGRMIVLWAKLPEIEYEYDVIFENSNYVLIHRESGDICALSKKVEKMEEIISTYFDEDRVLWKIDLTYDS